MPPPTRNASTGAWCRDWHPVECGWQIRFGGCGSAQAFGQITMRMTLRRIMVASALPLLVIGYWAGSEAYYARSISPVGVSSVSGYFRRFGEPRRVRQIEREGKRFFEFTGRGPSLPLLAFPSAPPCYVFDADGRCMEWCPDRGDGVQVSISGGHSEAAPGLRSTR